MNDLDKFFAADLEAGHAFQPSEENWQHIAARLDAEGKKPCPRWLPWAAGAGVLAIFSLAWVAWILNFEVRSLRAELAFLKNEVESPQSVGAEKTDGSAALLASPPEPRKEANFSQDLGSKLFSKPFSSSPSGSRFLKNTENKAIFQASSPFGGSGAEAKSEAEAPVFQKQATAASPQNPDLQTLKNRENPEKTRLGSLQFLPQKTPQAISQNQRLNIEVQQLSIQSKPIRPLKDPKFSIGISAQVSGAETGRNAESLGYAIGPSVQFRVWKNLVLTGDLGFSKTFFGSRDNDAFGHFHLPAPPSPPAPGFSLRETFAKRYGLETGLGLRWQFFPEKRIRPFVSAGWAGVFSKDLRLDYVFENDLTGSEVRVPAKFNPKHGLGLTHFFRPGLGVSGGLGRRLSWNLEAFGQISTLGNYGYGSGGIGLRAGLFF